MKHKIEFPFYALPIKLAARKDLQASDKIVFSVIRDYLGNNGICWPGVRTLSKDTGLAASTVVESIGRLEAKKILKVKRQGNGKSNHYSISKSVLKTSTVNKTKRTGNLNGQETKAQRKPNTGALKISTEAHRKSEPNQKEQLNQTKKVDFKCFWKIFKEHSPSAVGSKKNAETNWREAVKKSAPEKIIEGLLEFSSQHRRKIQNKEFAPNWKHCERWLKAEEWKIESGPKPQRGDPDWLPTEEEAEVLDRIAGVEA